MPLRVESPPHLLGRHGQGAGGLRIPEDCRVGIGHEPLPGHEGAASSVSGGEFKSGLALDAGLYHVHLLAGGAKDFLSREAVRVESRGTEDEVPGAGVSPDGPRHDGEVPLGV